MKFVLEDAAAPWSAQSINVDGGAAFY